MTNGLIYSVGMAGVAVQIASLLFSWLASWREWVDLHERWPGFADFMWGFTPHRPGAAPWQR